MKCLFLYKNDIKLKLLRQNTTKILVLLLKIKQFKDPPNFFLNILNILLEILQKTIRYFSVILLIHFKINEKFLIFNKHSVKQTK